MRESKPEAEIAALRAALDSEDDQVRATLLSGFSEELFGFEPTLEIFRKVIHLVSNGKSAPTSAILAQDMGISEAARSLLLSDTVIPVTTVDDARSILDTLNQYNQGRLYLDAIQNSTEIMSADSADISAVSDIWTKTLTKVQQQKAENQLFYVGKNKNTDDVVSKILSPKVNDLFIPTGFRGFDDMAGGLSRQNLKVVASHRKGGKSILMLNEGINMYRAGYSGCIVSLEMGEAEYLGRFLSSISGVPATKIRQKKCTPSELARIVQAYDEYTQYGVQESVTLSILPITAITVAEIGMLLKPYNYDYVMIDYLNLLTPSHPEGNEPKKLSELTRECKILTGILNCPVIVATQLDKNTGNIRYSRAIEEHADYVWTWKYDEEQEVSGVIEIDQLVSRHTERFSFQLRVDFNTMRMVDNIDVPRINSENNVASLNYMDGIC